MAAAAVRDKAPRVVKVLGDSRRIVGHGCIEGAGETLLCGVEFCDSMHGSFTQRRAAQVLGSVFGVRCLSNLLLEFRVVCMGGGTLQRCCPDASNVLELQSHPSGTVGGQQDAFHKRLASCVRDGVDVDEVVSEFVRRVGNLNEVARAGNDFETAHEGCIGLRALYV